MKLSLPRARRVALAVLAMALLALAATLLGSPQLAVAAGVLTAACGLWLLLGLDTNEAEPAPPAPREVRASGLAAYELLEPLGSGSMGELWKAKHKRLGRVVALKRIKAESVDAEDVARFKREARATSELRSPHTVQVYDFGEDEGELFYAMECLDGVDLQKVIEQGGPLPPARAIAVLKQACHSLAEAHAAGIVHRDIKPANLMLCRYGLDHDFVKLLDFGLAKTAATNTKATQAGGLTRQGIVLGTAAYLAPESIKGSSLVDARADIYALGAILFWMVTGRMVFLETQALKMVRAHLEEEPPVSSSVSPFALPQELDELIAACLAKNPDERPQTALELSQRLERIRIADPWTETNARDWWAQRDGAVAP